MINNPINAAFLLAEKHKETLRKALEQKKLNDAKKAEERKQREDRIKEVRGWAQETVDNMPVNVRKQAVDAYITEIMLVRDSGKPSITAERLKALGEQRVAAEKALAETVYNAYPLLNKEEMHYLMWDIKLLLREEAKKEAGPEPKKAPDKKQMRVPQVLGHNRDVLAADIAAPDTPGMRGVRQKAASL